MPESRDARPAVPLDVSAPAPPRAAPYDTAEAHGFTAFPTPVVLSISVTLNGTEFGYQHQVPRADWDYISSDPVMREGYERMLRGKLVETIVERLKLPVTVRVPTPLDEAIHRAGWDYCQPVELGSEG